MFAIVSGGCCPKRKLIRVETVKTGCIVDPIPVAGGIIAQDPGENSLCTGDGSLCVDMVRLNRYLSEAQRWMTSAEKRCKVKQ